jgi:hypothetical protein
MCAASAAPAPLCTRARVTLAFAPPLPAPALTSPRSSTSPAACPCAPCHRCSTPRRRCRAGHRCAVLRRSPRPRVTLLLLPPPVQPPLSSPRLATPGPNGCHGPEGTPAPPAVLGLARDYPLSLSSPKQCAAIKPTRTPPPLV